MKKLLFSVIIACASLLVQGQNLPAEVKVKFIDKEKRAASFEMPYPPEFVENGSGTINIKADLQKWFQGNFELRIAENPVISTPGELAVNLADNYQHMFSVISVKNTE